MLGRYIHIIIGLLVFSMGISQDIRINQVAVPFANTSISGLAQDNFGNIWIASNNQGLYKYNGDNYKPVSYTHLTLPTKA